MAEKQIKSHDGFFKKIFSKKAEVKEFLEKTTNADKFVVNEKHI